MKKVIILIFILILLVIFSSGCTNKNATNGTFGEKTVSIANITIINSITEDTEFNGTNYFYIHGYLKNNNKNDAFNLKMKATVFDAEGNIVAVNDTVQIEPKVISADGESFYLFIFNNKDNKIVRFELQLISVDAKAD